MKSLQVVAICSLLVGMFLFIFYTLDMHQYLPYAVQVKEVSVYDMHTCPKQPSNKQLYHSLVYLLGDLEETERLSREPKGELGKGIKYLDNYKNPCWLEELPSKPFHYRKTRWKHMVLPRQVAQVHKSMTPILTKRGQLAQGNNNGTRLRCIPYIMVLGMHKAGSSDFYDCLSLHPLVERVGRREPQFWSHLPEGTTLSDYLDYYDYAAEKIHQYQEANGFHPKVTLDGSTHTYQSFPGNWTRHPWNKHTGRQCITLPQQMNHVTPNMKFILLLRNPISWVESCFNYFKGIYYKNGPIGTGYTTNALRIKVIADVRAINKCIKDTNDTVWCAYNQTGQDWCNIAHTVYYAWAKMWIEGVGRENILFVNADLYFRNRGPTLGKVFKFLGLPELSGDDLKKATRKRAVNSNSRRKKVKLDKVALETLRDFVEPWNKTTC